MSLVNWRIIKPVVNLQAYAIWLSDWNRRIGSQPVSEHTH